MDGVKNKKRFSGSTLSTKYLTDQGYVVANVEQTVRYPKKDGRRGPKGQPLEWNMFKRDLFNIADLLAVSRKAKGCLFVQYTTDKNVEAHFQKIAGLPVARTLVAAENRIHVYGWKVSQGKGKPKTYSLTVHEITFDEDGLMQVNVVARHTVGEQEALFTEEAPGEAGGGI